ncbi:MAG: DUF1080 domain-containing protein [Acidobacteria bacterium]|nr:DUF1080 domain-containing protein [Acidobacteriota bacterium]
MRSRFLVAISIIFFVTTLAFAGGWKKLFDGKSLKGWSRKAVHGGRGGIWVVENGALVADQEKDHTGGLLGTERPYSDFEIELEFQADYPVDTGLFLRTREDGMGYQITLDYRDKGYVGSLYAPAAGDFLVQYAEWKKIYKEQGWNHLRARIEGQPAHLTAYLNNVKTIDFTDSKERYPRAGYIGLQVHGGQGAWGATSKARFRNLRIKELH